MTDLPLLNLRAPLTVRHKDTGRVLLIAPLSSALARSHDTVDYEGEELSIPHLCYETVEYTSLAGADLRGLFLYNTVFAHVRLDGADFTGAHLRDTVFLDCTRLGQAIGLDRILHDGPSCLDARTLRACGALLPKPFLEGAGYRTEEVQAFRA